MRARKLSKNKDDIMFEKVQVMIKAELRSMRTEMEGELYAALESHKGEIMGPIGMKGELQNYVRAEVNVVEIMFHKKLENAVATFETWKSEMEQSIREKDAQIENLKKQLTACKEKLDTNEGSLNNKTQPHLQEEVKELKTSVENGLKAWSDVVKQHQKNTEWIEVTKKQKTSAAPSAPSIINDTLEEEKRRKGRAFNVRVVGWKEEKSPKEDALALCAKMGANDRTPLDAWRIGKDASKERPLILKFDNMEEKKGFLSHRRTLKGEKIFLDDDLTLAQVAHRKECMPRIIEARKAGKWAVYRDGKVIISEKRST